MTCPFLESDNPNCSAVLSLAHIPEAMEFCTDDYEHCPIYLQLTGSQSHAKPVAVAAGS